MLDKVLENMGKKVQPSNKKLGRPEEISDRELLDRFKALKQFLEQNWGRIGFKLQKARRPDDVKTALRIVPYVEQFSAFRDRRAARLLEDGNTEVGLPELRVTQEKYADAKATHDRLWSEYHKTKQSADGATTTLKVFISQFEAAIGLFPFFFVAAQFAKMLGVAELTNKSNQLWASLQLAQDEKKSVEAILSSQEAWYARKELVRFARNRRYEKSVTNIAKAMAGLPDYGWLYSLRRCSQIKEIKENSIDVATNYQLFKVLEGIIKKTKPLRLNKVEAKLRAELLREGGSWLLRAQFGHSWWDVEQGFRACAGKKISRKEMPYRLMAAIQDSLERGKTLPEQELAKRAQLV
jgi:hypothetical protein